MAQDEDQKDQNNCGSADAYAKQAGSIPLADPTAASSSLIATNAVEILMPDPLPIRSEELRCLELLLGAELVALLDSK